jgi:serine/threonine-protein kinase
MSTDVPQRIGRYTIDRLIGAGAMGNVFLGRDPELDRAIAVKTVRIRDLAAEARQLYLDRFKNEARAAARLHHPNIVAVYDVGEDPDVGPYLVLEYVAGSSLKQLLTSRGPLTPEACVTLADQIGRAIDTAHAAGIIHRDIKPDNLLITPEGRAKLADFGVARVPDAALTREGQFLGTPCYAAPETLKTGEYGPHTDLFSFAAVLYEAVSGVRAFPGDEAVAVAHKVLHDDPPAPSSIARTGATVPPAVDALILRALSRDTSRRLPTATDLARALRAAYAATGAVEPPPSGTESTLDSGVTPIAQPARSSAGVFLAVLAVGLLGSIGLVWWLGGDTTDLPVNVDDAGVDAIAQDATSVRDAAPAAADDARDAGVDQGTPDGGIDAGTDAGFDAGLADAPVDAGAPELTARQREEGAKDLLDHARALLSSGDAAGARRALDDARRLDPGNSDLDAVAAAIEAAHP